MKRFEEDFLSGKWKVGRSKMKYIETDYDNYYGDCMKRRKKILIPHGLWLYERKGLSAISFGFWKESYLDGFAILYENNKLGRKGVFKNG